MLKINQSSLFVISSFSSYDTEILFVKLLSNKIPNLKYVWQRIHHKRISTFISKCLVCKQVQHMQVSIGMSPPLTRASVFRFQLQSNPASCCCAPCEPGIRDQGSSAYIPTSPMGDSVGVPAFWVQPGPAQKAATIQGVNQQIESLYLCPSCSLSLSLQSYSSFPSLLCHSWEYSHAVTSPVKNKTILPPLLSSCCPMSLFLDLIKLFNHLHLQSLFHPTHFL